jgi:hypothetical protein
MIGTVGANERKLIWSGGRNARYVPTGHLVFVVGTTLMGIAFDVEKLQVRGGSVSILDGIMHAINPSFSGAAQFAFSGVVPWSTYRAHRSLRRHETWL